jgi:hypothetical protein
MKQSEEQELVFLEALRQHENRWIAILESAGSEVIVGSGLDAVAALADAEAKGFTDAILFKVPPFDASLVPSGRSACVN